MQEEVLETTLNENNIVETEVTAIQKDIELDHSKLDNLDYEHSGHTGFQPVGDYVEDVNYVHTDNNYTTTEKTKLANLENYDDTEVKASITSLQTNKADKSEIPDVSNFITNAVDDLVNYYKKSETYTQSEVNALISAITTISIVVVNELPVTGEANIIYLVPSADPQTQNIKDEYIWVNNAWEKIGSTDIDLTDYVKNTDYATGESGGVIKISPYYATEINSGYLGATQKTYSQYESSPINLLIGKGTLENVITGKGLVSNTDYATNNVGGVIKTSSSYGADMSNGFLTGYVRTYTDYGNVNDKLIISKGTLENVITGKGLLDSSKVVNATSTTAGEVYDVRYINSVVGDINTILATLVTVGGNE